MRQAGSGTGVARRPAPSALGHCPLPNLSRAATGFISVPTVLPFPEHHRNRNGPASFTVRAVWLLFELLSGSLRPTRGLVELRVVSGLGEYSAAQRVGIGPSVDLLSSLLGEYLAVAGLSRQAGARL